MFRRMTKKRSIAGLAVIAVLALAGAAYAYFTTTGTGTSSGATVGSATNFTVSPGTATGGPLYPGAGSISIPYTVTNPGTGHQALTATTAAIASSGGNVTQGGTPVSGCLASWFNAANTPPASLPQDLAPGATSTSGSVTVTMTNASASQNSCQGVHPDVTISAS